MTKLIDEKLLREMVRDEVRYFVKDNPKIIESKIKREIRNIIKDELTHKVKIWVECRMDENYLSAGRSFKDFLKETLLTTQNELECDIVDNLFEKIGKYRTKELYDMVREHFEVDFMAGSYPSGLEKLVEDILTRKLNQAFS